MLLYTIIQTLQYIDTLLLIYVTYLIYREWLRKYRELVFVTRVRTDHFCQGSIWYPGLPLTKVSSVRMNSGKGILCAHAIFIFFPISATHQNNYNGSQ